MEDLEDPQEEYSESLNFIGGPSAPRPASPSYPPADHATMSISEHVISFLQHFLFSPTYSIILVVLIAVNMVVLYWTLSHHSAGGAWVSALDMVVSLVMVLEIAFKLVFLGRHFWFSCSNVLDFFVVLFCIAGKPPLFIFHFVNFNFVLQEFFFRSES